MSELLRNFMDELSDEEKRLRQASMDNASSESGTLPLKVSGTYLMEVATFAWRDKDSKEMRVSPEPFVSEKKKSLNLRISLRVVDGTPQAPKGSSIITNINLSPAAGADQEKFDNVNRILKPKLAILTGEKDIKLSAEWFEEWLIAKFKEEDGQFVLKKDHKMKKQFLAIVEDDIYKDKETLKVTTLLEAKEGAKSVSNNPIMESRPKQGSTVPSSDDYKPINADDAIINEIDSASSAIPDIPDDIEDYQ